ncbi:MAG: TIGR00282 family metallophosphoesterase [Candidatus Hydrothermales bacterium]
MDTLNILFIGDVVGKPGRIALKKFIPLLKKYLEINFIITNVENAAHGSGITEKIFNEIVNCGVNCLTSGNHIWDKKDILKWIDTKENILRPLNYPDLAPGRGYAKFNVQGIELYVINLMGRVFINPLECPFKKFDETLRKIKLPIIVDFHAEATSEKVAFAFYADGKVSAIVGTHTHIQTSDNIILPKGTGYITDVGMTGGFDSVIGGEKESIINRFLSGIPYPFSPSNSKLGLDGCLIELKKDNFMCRRISRIQIRNQNDNEYLLKIESSDYNYNIIKEVLNEDNKV